MLLEQNVFAEVWMYPDSVDIESFIPVMKTRLVDNFFVELRNGSNVYTSMVKYREICQSFELSL